MNSTSNFYLERVGFEAKVNFRHSLKNGTNLIGRNDVPGVDIGINSLTCSRKHCVLNVTGDSVSIEDLRSSNGTTINGVKMKAEKLKLKENDLIGIVGGTNSLADLVGNYVFTVYRLCKYTSENIQTFEIEDDDPIELSDNDEENIICLDSDGESMNIKEEHDDLDMLLSRNFNIEIKRELAELDEDEEYLKQLKREPADDDTEDFNQSADSENEEVATIVDEQQRTSIDDVPADYNDAFSDNDSNDSAQTVCFSAVEHQQTNVNGPPDDPSTPLSDHTNLESNKPTTKDLELKLLDAVSRISDYEDKRKKRGPQMIYAKPLEKRRKTNSEDSPRNAKAKKQSKSEIKAKLKAVSEATVSTSSKAEKKPAAHTTPKVKFTPNNRGSFLTDVKQMPASPREIQQKLKETVTEEMKTISEKVMVSPEKVAPVVVPTPPELEQKIWENMHSCASTQDQIVQTNEQKEGRKLTGSTNPVLDMNDNDSFTHDDEEENGGLDFQCNDIEMDTEGNEEDENFIDDDDDDEDINLLNILMKLPAETCTVVVIETEPRPATLKSILKCPDSTPSNVTAKKRRVTFKETGFQFDPSHKIISDLTAYDCSQFKTVEDFCHSVDLNVGSFADSYDEYKDYRNTLVPLLLLELWKEIEMEYVNSKIHGFTTVAINDQNLEKRGDGRRMIIHCQNNSLYKSQSICDGHLLLAMCTCNGNVIEFLAYVTHIAYSSKQANQKVAYFTIETSALTESLPTEFLRIRPITVIKNTVNNFSAIHNLNLSPLQDLVINPLSVETVAPRQQTAQNLTFKTYDVLDNTQRRILGSIYRRCIDLNVPNISLVDGAAGTGKTCLIANLALQLVYGDELPKPLRILICSKSNGSINDLTRKLIRIRDDTSGNNKIQVVRFGMLENMDLEVQRVSVQSLKETQQPSPQFTSYEDLVNQQATLELKITALSLDNDTDHSTNLKVLQKQLFKVNALLDRFEGLEKKKLRDTTTFILNSCDIICTTLASIPKLQSYVSKVDVCIIDEATQCSEPLTLLPFQFGMSSLVLVGDSQFAPLVAYSSVVKERNYGNSLFSRLQKLYLGKFGSPVYEMHFQYRMHQEILMWPNYQYYKNRLVPHAVVMDDSFPIVPYKIISYDLGKGIKESDYVFDLVKVLLRHVDWNAHTFGMICTNLKQNFILKNKLRDYPYISTNTADSYMSEKDVVIIWVSQEHGICQLAHQQILNAAVSRAKKSLLIFGANLTVYKNRPVWKSLLENALSRKCLQHLKILTTPKICNALNKNILQVGRNQCVLCNQKFN